MRAANAALRKCGLKKKLGQLTRLLTSAHGGHIPTVPYDAQHPKAEHLSPERYVFQ